QARSGCPYSVVRLPDTRRDTQQTRSDSTAKHMASVGSLPESARENQEAPDEGEARSFGTSKRDERATPQIRPTRMPTDNTIAGSRGRRGTLRRHRDRRVTLGRDAEAIVGFVGAPSIETCGSAAPGGTGQIRSTSGAPRRSTHPGDATETGRRPSQQV